MSNQSDSTIDICKAASKPSYSFRLTGDESNDAADSKAMREVLSGLVVSKFGI